MESYLLRAVAITVALLCSSAHTDAAAQPKQTTTGSNSPIISDNRGVVILNTAVSSGEQQRIALQALRDAARQFATRNEPVFSRLRASISRGDLEGARKMIVQALLSAQTQIEQIALLKYVEGLLLLVDRRPAESLLSIRAAVSLQPDNCVYMGLESTLLVKLDRMTEAAAFAHDARPELAKCLKAAEPLERAMLLSVAARVSAEQRDLTNTRLKLDWLDLALDQLTLAPGPDRLEQKTSIVCDFPRLVRELLGTEVATAGFQGSVDRCLKINARLGKDSKGYSKLWIEQNYDVLTTPELAEEKLRILSDALVAIDTLPVLPNLGLSALWLQFKRAELLSNRGFHRLWQMNDPKGAHDDYLLAYRTIVPLLAVQWPEIFHVYGFLVPRFIHFNELFPAMALPDLTPETLKRDLSVLIKGPPTYSTMELCEALSVLADSVSSAQGSDVVQFVDSQRRDCLSRMLDKTTLRFQRQTYKSHQISANRAVHVNDLVRAETSLSEGIRAAENLYGFPLWLEKNHETLSSITQRAAVRQKLGKNREAEQDLRTAVDFSRKGDMNHGLPQNLLYLASQLAQGGEGSLKEAQSFADEAVAIYYEKLVGREPPSCGNLLLYGGAKLLATQVAATRDIYADFLVQLNSFDGMVEYVSRCRDVTMAAQSEHRNALSALMMIFEAREARNALPEGFVTVQAAALAGRKALEGAMAGLGGASERSSFPLLDQLLRIAGSPTPAR